jgi:hypothetical protein
MSKNYGTYGSYLGNGKKLNQDYDVPNGSLLDTPDNSTGIDVHSYFNGPSPYNYKQFSYGKGPQTANVSQEYLNTNDKSIFLKKPVLREPTGPNPMMNVNPLDYGMNPVFNNYNRYEAKNYPSKKNNKIRTDIKTEFEKGLYKDADSLLWNRVNSQREFVSMPVGSVPNEQGEFGNWLYGVDKVCKSGSIWDKYGVKYTDDSLVCNGFNVAEPTNKGLLGGNLMSSFE